MATVRILKFPNNGIDKLFCKAAALGENDIIKKFIDNVDIVSHNVAYAMAARNGQLSTVKLLLKSYYVFPHYEHNLALRASLFSGQLDMFWHLFSINIIKNTIKYEDLHKVLFSNKCKISSKMTITALDAYLKSVLVK